MGIDAWEGVRDQNNAQIYQLVQEIGQINAQRAQSPKP
jgi:hypothetical protein